MVGLALHGSEAAHLPHQPVGGLPVLARAGGVGHLVVLVVAVDEVLQDAAALEDADGLAVIERVCESRDAAVGVDLEEPGLLSGGMSIDCSAWSCLLGALLTFCVFLEISILVTFLIQD